jgi:hypothetical protein
VLAFTPALIHSFCSKPIPETATLAVSAFADVDNNAIIIEAINFLFMYIAPYDLNVV